MDDDTKGGEEKGQAGVCTMCGHNHEKGEKCDCGCMG